MLEDTNSLDGAQLKRRKKKNTNQSDSLCPYGAGALYNPKWIRLYYLELVRLRSWNTHRETDNGGISRGCPECSCRRDGRSTVSIFLLYYLQLADNLTATSAVFPFLGISLVYMKISVPSFHPKRCKWLEWHNKVFSMSIPNKFIQFWARLLPILLEACKKCFCPTPPIIPSNYVWPSMLGFCISPPQPC